MIANGFHADRKGGQDPLVIAHEDARRNAASGGDVIGHLKIEFQAGEAEAADQAADQQSRHHGGDDEEQQIVG